MEGVVALLCIFGLPPFVALYWLKIRHERNLKELELSASNWRGSHLRSCPRAAMWSSASATSSRSSAASTSTLNSKLNRLASRQLQLAATVSDSSPQASISKIFAKRRARRATSIRRLASSSDSPSRSVQYANSDGVAAFR